MSKIAIVTGASSGIGHSFAKHLAAEGYNFILVARHEDTLNEVKQELESQFNIHAEVFLADLSKIEDIRRLEDRVALCPYPHL